MARIRHLRQVPQNRGNVLVGDKFIANNRIISGRLIWKTAEHSDRGEK
jgi:hypothetical protein